LEYVGRGNQPRVQVVVSTKDKTIEIVDNGRGMDRLGLGHYFTMHGENRDRLAGRPGRGKFGTGKSAAFGIARLLRIDTRKDGVRNVVELTRDMIDKSKGEDIPVRSVVVDEQVEEPNGTIVAI